MPLIAKPNAGLPELEDGKTVYKMTPDMFADAMRGLVEEMCIRDRFVICAQIEQELADLDEDEKKEYLEDLGVESSGLDKLCLLYTSVSG